MPVSKVCQHCNKTFEVPNRRSELVKYCSRECKALAGWEDKTCACCGVVFRRKKSDMARSSVYYCSRECSDKSRLGKKHKVLPDAKRYYKVCETCGKDFRVTETRKDTARWCSRSCQSKSEVWKDERKDGVIVKCKECGKEMHVAKSRVARGNGRFCSKSCMHKNEEYRTVGVEKRSGENHYRWNGAEYKSRRGYVYVFLKTRKVGSRRTVAHRIIALNALVASDPTHPFLVLDTDGNFALRPGLNVHHIDRVRANNDLSNLLIVTTRAHGHIHASGKKPDPWECWPSNPDRW